METALELLPGKLHVILASRAEGYRLLNACAARLAMKGPVQVIDGGNGFDAYSIARQVRSQIAELGAALRRIGVRRAFTCYQMLALLAQYRPSPQPLLIMDLLATFADENVAKTERLRLLNQAIGYLIRAGPNSSIGVGISLPTEEAYLSMIETALKPEEAIRVVVWRNAEFAPQPTLRLF
jgi:hypothetical protein